MVACSICDDAAVNRSDAWASAWLGRLVGAGEAEHLPAEAFEGAAIVSLRVGQRVR